MINGRKKVISFSIEVSTTEVEVVLRAQQDYQTQMLFFLALNHTIVRALASIDMRER